MPKKAIREPGQKVSASTRERKGGIERLRASDPRISELLTDEQRGRLMRDPNYSLDVEFSPVRSPRGAKESLVPTRIVETPDVVLRDFKLAVDEDAFVSACSLEPTDSKWGRLHLALMRPDANFMQAVRKEGVSLFELNQFWHDSQQHRGTIRMMNHLPDVMEETAVEARARTVKCRTCDGTQVVVVQERPVVEAPDGTLMYGEKVLVRKACPECVDSIVPGTVVRPGDLESKKLMFKVAGLLKDGQTNVNIDNRSVSVGVETEVSAIGRILERKPVVQIPTRVEVKEG